MRVVEAAPSGFDVGARHFRPMRDFTRRRSAAELDEKTVRQVAKLEVVLVHLHTLTACPIRFNS